MATPAEPQLSLLIATRNRAAWLTQLLEQVEAARGAAGVGSEVIVVDNGSGDATPDVLAAWQGSGAGRVALRVEQKGKSRALNRALPLARAPLLVFTDDDVEVPVDWLREVVAFFAAHAEFGAAMGRVRVPASVTDPELLGRIALFQQVAYPPLPLFDRGEDVIDVRGVDLYGCNMAIRRAVIAEVGDFHERLGPGVTGFGEDTELGERIARAGHRVGYMPAAVVYHRVEPERLTARYYRQAHRYTVRIAAELGQPPDGWLRNLLRVVDASLAVALWTVTGRAQRRLRAEARVARCLERLRVRWEMARRARG